MPKPQKQLSKEELIQLGINLWVSKKTNRENEQRRITKLIEH